MGNDPLGRMRDMSGVIDQNAATSGNGYQFKQRLATQTQTMVGLDGPGAVYTAANSQTMISPYNSDQNLLDDRGLIYVRYGTPDQRATYNGAGVAPNESWKYLTPSGELIFHFVGPVAPTRLQAHLLYSPDLYASRGSLDPRYDQLAFQLRNGGNSIQSDLLEEERQRNIEAVDIGTTTDAFPLRFANRLTATVQAYGLGNLPGAGTGAVVTFAVRAEHLAPMEHAPVAGTVYPLHFRIIADRLSDSRVTEQDTVRNFVTPAGLKADQYLTGQSVLPLPPGLYLVNVVVGDGTGRDGVALTADTVVVPSLAGSHLSVSDVVLGFGGATQQLSLGADRVPLDPLGAVPAGSDVTVYYQTGGLVAGQRYHTELEVHRRYNPGSRDRVKVAFDDKASSSSASYNRTISLGSLSSGAYEVQLTVKAPGGAEVVRRRMLNVK